MAEPILDDPSPSKFGTADILVSRTDKRAIIQTANELFQTVSGYPWQKLHRAPHKIIRHQDMPKGVFWQFWNILQKDEPIGAFFKNKSADGGHYWVFAIATSIDDGYTSVRLKPQGKIFDSAVEMYDERLSSEKLEKCSPEESAHLLVGQIQALGYRDYKAFMTKAAVEQIRLRDEELRHPKNTVIAHMEKAVEAWDEVAAEIRKADFAFADFERLQVNMQIQASHLSGAGNALRVIAGNLSTLTKQVEALMAEFLRNGNELETTLLDGLFHSCVKHVQNEVVSVFQHEEKEMEGVEKDLEVSVIQKQNERFEDHTMASLEGITNQSESFRSLFGSIKTLHSSVSVTRITAEIEIRQLQNSATSSLSGIIEELKAFLDTERDRLIRMIDGTQVVQSEVRHALMQMNTNRSPGRSKPIKMLKAS